jgi:polyisoprenoid-binding protein YceI
MKRRLRPGVFLALATAGGLAGEPPVPSECPGRTVAHFYGKSNIHPFEGVTDTIAFTVTGKRSGTEDTDTLLSTTFKVPVRSLTTHNEGRDGDMYKMFEAETYPHITVRVPPVSLSRLRPNGMPSQAESGTFGFAMTIRSTTRNLRGRIDQWREDGASCRFRARFRVSLDSFGLEPPRPFLGMLYVKDTVRVEAPVWIDKPSSSAEGSE